MTLAIPPLLIPATWRLPWIVGVTLALAVLLVKPRWLRTAILHLEQGCRQLSMACAQVVGRILAITPPDPDQRRQPAPSPGSMGNLPTPQVQSPLGSTSGAEQAEHMEHAETPWLGFVLLARLSYGALATLLLLSMYSLDSGRSCVVQLGGGDCAIPVPISVNIANGVLWFVVVAYFGGLWAEGVGWVQRHLHLFPSLTRRARTTLTVYASIGVALSMIAISLLYVLGQLALLNTTWPLMTLIISGVQGLLVNGAGIPAVASLIFGVGAAFATVATVGSWLFALLQRLLALLGHILERPARVTPGSAASAAHAMDGPEVAMSTDTARALYLLGLGRFGSSFVPSQFVPAVERYGGHSVLGGWGIVDHTRLERAPRLASSQLDLSPLQSDVQQARLMRGDSGETAQLVTQQLMRNVVQRAAAAGQAKGLIVIALDLGAVDFAVASLQELASQVPGHTRLALLRLPAPGELDPQTRRARLETLAALREAGALTSIIPIDPRSPLAQGSREVGEAGQERFVAAATGQSIAAHVQDDVQPSFAELMLPLGRQFPYCALATISASVPVGQEVWLSKITHVLFRMSKRGYGEMGITRNRILELAERLLDDPLLRCVDAPVNRQEPPLVFVVTVPMRARDPRWQVLCDDVEVELISRVPTASVVFVHGNGVRDRRIPDHYYVQVSLYYGCRAMSEGTPSLPTLAIPDAATHSSGASRPGPTRTQWLPDADVKGGKG